MEVVAGPRLPAFGRRKSSPVESPMVLHRRGDDRGGNRSREDRPSIEAGGGFRRRIGRFEVLLAGNANPSDVVQKSAQRQGREIGGSNPREPRSFGGDVVPEEKPQEERKMADRHRVTGRFVVAPGDFGHQSG